MFWNRNRYSTRRSCYSAGACCTSCRQSCTCNSCCHTCCRKCCKSCGFTAQAGPEIETWYYAVRVIDIPMTTYYGEGYTEIDCCVDTKNVLQEISDTLKQAVGR